MAILPQHLALLARFSISKKLLATADVRSFDDTAARNALGTNANPTADLSGIGFHYRSPETNTSWGWRVRLDNVIAGDNTKYLMDYGNRHLFFPPDAQKLLKDSESSVIIVEAEKSVLALVEFFERQKKDFSCRNRRLRRVAKKAREEVKAQRRDGIIFRSVA